MLNRLKRMLRVVFHKPYDVSTQEGRRLERERRIALTALTGALAKMIATAIPLITVKFSLNYLGSETYGLWAAVTSFFSLFAFADLGLGNGLQTELSRATGTDDMTLCRKLVSSAYFMLSLVAGSLLLVFILIYPFINWASLMNAQTETAVALAGSVVLAIVVSKLLNIPVALVQRTQIAIQEGYKSNIWQCAASVLSLVSVIFVSTLDLGPLTMIWFSSLIVVIIALMNMIVFFGFQRKDLRPSFKMVDKKLLKVLMTTGIAFFFLSILTSLSLSLDSFIVAKTASLSDATPYSIAYKIAHLIGIVSTMLSTPLWAANGEALERGDYKWVKKRTNSMAALSLLISGAASLFLIAVANPILSWMKPGMTLSIQTLIGMCLMQVGVATISPYFMILNAGRVIKKQIFIYGVFTVISLGLKYFLAPVYGTVGIAWIGALCYIAIIMPFTYITSQKVLRAEKSHAEN